MELISHKGLANKYHIIMYMYTPQIICPLSELKVYACMYKNCLQSASQHHYTPLLALLLGCLGWWGMAGVVGPGCYGVVGLELCGGAGVVGLVWCNAAGHPYL